MRDKVSKKQEGDGIYNRAKNWQLAFFSLNTVATNVALMLIGYYAMFTQNVLGLSAVVVGFIAASMRIFDGITDPIIGFIIDKTNSKWGKFRPFIILGCAVQVIGLLAIFNCPAGLSATGKYIFTGIFYVIYVLGYTFQTACGKGGQTILTNAPEQRPRLSAFKAGFNVLFIGGMTVLAFSVLAQRYEGKTINPHFWTAVSLLSCAVMIFLTTLSVIAISEKDHMEYFGKQKAQKIRFRDYLPVIKHNRPLQMLIIAAATDKLALATSNAARVYLFANIFLSVALQGKFSMYTMVPQIIVVILIIALIGKRGQKLTFMIGTWASMACLILMYIIGPNPERPAVFLSLMFLQSAAAMLANTLVMTMIADCTDYENLRSGNFIPGMIGTLFSFVDKIISSFAAVIWSLLLAFIGMGHTILTPEVSLGGPFNAIVMFAVCGMPILGHIASVISMRFYKLDGKTMTEIQKQLAERKAAAEKAEASV